MSVTLESVGGELEANGVKDVLVNHPGMATAWVNFDGTQNPPSIRASYNISSVVKNSNGVYTIEFETPMDNVNYVVAGVYDLKNITTSYVASINVDTFTTNGFKAYAWYGSNGGPTDVSIMNIVVFGGKN